jgi:hypothetical protein
MTDVPAVQESLDTRIAVNGKNYTVTYTLILSDRYYQDGSNTEKYPDEPEIVGYCIGFVNIGEDEFCIGGSIVDDAGTLIGHGFDDAGGIEDFRAFVAAAGLNPKKARDCGIVIESIAKARPVRWPMLS